MPQNNNFLKKIELQGFKSFADKTVLDFSEDLVGVVGPNGSGKSNIIDAVRWALGETGASYLRGDVLKNLIFAGTPKKSAAGLAKVTLHFDNSSGILSLDTDEVSVTRKIDRSGTSDFFLNGEEVRLKDLKPIFARAKLGSRGLTIIGQGQSDVFVKIKPEERRRMIEEILGLKEFRIKKKKAKRRLDKTEDNLEKIRAKISELKPHLKFLKKQKEKWDKKQEVQSELEELSDDYFSFKFQKLTTKLSKTNNKLSELRKRKKEKKKKISRLENKLEEIKEPSPQKKELKKIREKTKKVKKKRDKLERKLAKVEAKEKYIAQESEKSSQNYPQPSVMAEKIETFLDDIKPLYKEEKFNEVLNKLRNWLKEFEKIITQEEEENEKQKEKKEEKHKNLQDRIKNIKAEIKELNEKIEKLRKKEDSLLENQEEQNIEFRERMEEIEKRKTSLRETEEKIQSESVNKEKAQFKLKEIKNKWTSLGFSIEKLKEISEEKDLKQEDKNWDKIEKRINKLSSKLSAIGEVDTSMLDEFEETKERYESLKEEKEDLEKAHKDLKNLISDLDNKIHDEFKDAFSHINKEFNDYFRLMFGGGKASLKLEKPDKENEGEEIDKYKEAEAGVEIDLNVPRKKVTGLDMLSGGEKTLVSIAALFALISVSPPPFLILDEIDAALDDINSKRFSDLINEFSSTTQFIIVTHNRITMESLDALYGITMGDDGVSKVVSLKLEEAQEYTEKESRTA
ncbi:MAG: AAA family ATPase [Candidatus Magasanikbacteria bacterium]